MTRLNAIFAAFLVASAQLHAQSPLPVVPLKRGMVVTKSVRIAPGRYTLSAPQSLDSALITVRGSNITLDLAGVYLEGSPANALPDEAEGVAVRIDGGQNIRVSGLHARGFRVGILARGTRTLTLARNDLSHNWKPRLFSLVEHESLVDWLSFHHNEKREWLRFGAGVYLDSVRGGQISENRAVQGMNGLLMTNTDSLNISDNEFAFNSGLGIGMYRSSYNRVLHNRMDYNVRGYSHGFFRRGQDSAGLLMFEQCSHNVVAWNSVTHGGDGLFLWAGQSTMDTGQGGANDNLYFGNDFSFAPTNGMEATFSRNDFIANRIEGSDNGLWGGYSYSSRVLGNCFSRNRTGIAIEHGQENLISHNRFDGDSLAVSLWANPIEPSDWGYPKHRDTRSRDYRITGNIWAAVRQPTKIQNTTVSDSSGNIAAESEIADCSPSLLLADEYAQFAPSAPQAMRVVPSSPVSRLKRSAIVVDEWGPFDWKSPKLWPVDSTHAEPLRLAVLGPVGSWRVVSQRGVKSISRTRGKVGDTISVSPGIPLSSTAAGATAEMGNRDWEIVLEYTGAITTSPTGALRAAGAPYRFSFGQFEPVLTKGRAAEVSAGWSVTVHRWSDTTAKTLSPDALTATFKTEPLLTRSEKRLDYFWYRPTIAKFPQHHVTVQATGEINLPAQGEFTLRTISDDGVRVWIDDKLVIDNLAPHESAVDYAPLSAGKHSIRVEYFQVDGWSELRVDFIRGRHHSSGSAGPH